MKVLIDENLPRKLKGFLGNHEVFTVREMGWSDQSNGELLTLLHAEGFDVLITADRNLRFQQPLQKHSAAVALLKAPNNRLQTLRQIVPKILRTFDFLKPGQIHEISL